MIVTTKQMWEIDVIMPSVHILWGEIFCSRYYGCLYHMECFIWCVCTL